MDEKEIQALCASCTEKQEVMIREFASCTTREALYNKIIALGEQLPLWPIEEQKEELRVIGCQSKLYLKAELREKKIFFSAMSDALISSGLAALLLPIYSGEAPGVVLLCPPHHLKALNIVGSLTPNRANGLYSIYRAMQRHAVAHA